VCRQFADMGVFSQVSRVRSVNDTDGPIEKALHLSFWTGRLPNTTHGNTVGPTRPRTGSLRRWMTMQGSMHGGNARPRGRRKPGQAAVPPAPHRTPRPASASSPSELGMCRAPGQAKRSLGASVFRDIFRALTDRALLNERADTWSLARCAHQRWDMVAPWLATELPRLDELALVIAPSTSPAPPSSISSDTQSGPPTRSESRTRTPVASKPTRAPDGNSSNHGPRPARSPTRSSRPSSPGGATNYSSVPISAANRCHKVAGQRPCRQRPSISPR
jgi:hypothetical protein